MFEAYLGRNQAAIFDDPVTRKGCELWLAKVLAAYGENGESDTSGGIDVEIIEGQLGLCAKTAEYIYSAFTPLTLHYQPGSRPMLERVVAEVTQPEMSEREKFFAILRRCRDNRHRGMASPALFQGGSEEELLKRGARMCNEISRIFVCLCQVAGIPARVHSSHITGHMMAEAFVDGRWAWVDPMKGMAPRLDDDRLANAWDLYCDPKLFERQPKEFWDDVRPAAPAPEQAEYYMACQMARNRDCYFHPKEAMAIGNYYVWDYERYTYPWSLHCAHEKQRQALITELLRLKWDAGWPPYFFDQRLFNEKLKMRKT
jgi:hypothetical protein